MNPALRIRFSAPLGGILLVLTPAAALGSLPACARPLVPIGSVLSGQFFETAKKFGHAAINKFDGAHPTSSVTAQSSALTASGAQPAQLADLGWLAGRWIGKWGPRTAEQTWTPPEAGQILGTFRLFEDNHTLLVELYAINQKPGGIELRFRHFTPELVPWEKSAATDLSLESYDSKKWVFLNSANGEPKRSIIIRVDPDTYTLRSEISASDGPTRTVDITFHRQGTPARKPRHK
ncbi:MAG TPA: DUF6265 family protein [Candidatus Acidoferrum sp.]|nr:DUF6265 family protein [Candidatus Acidoferrum sp.]